MEMGHAQKISNKLMPFVAGVDGADSSQLTFFQFPFPLGILNLFGYS